MVLERNIRLIKHLLMICFIKVIRQRKLILNLRQQEMKKIADLSN